MRILVTGGSSFVGAHLCRVAAREHQVVGLYHSNPLHLNGVEPLRADLRRARDVARIQATRPEAVIHVAAKIKASPSGELAGAQVAANTNREMMAAVLSLGVPVVYASSTVVHWDDETPYGRCKREDEEALRDSGLPYAIFRPSAPYGPRLANHQPRHKESFHTLADLVRRLPVVPVIGDGQYRRQPVHVDDFSAALLAPLSQGFHDGAYDVGGAEAIPFDEVIDTLARVMGKRVRKLHLPKALFVQFAKRSRDFDPALIAAIDSDEVADPAELTAAYGVRPRSFAEGARWLV